MKRIKSIGFPITDKENERRRAILPADLALVEGEGEFVVQAGYGADLGAPDADYAAAGARIGSLEDALACDLVVDPKVGDAGYLGSLPKGATVFGWVHATQNRCITDALLAARATAFAWEKMYDRGRHVFWRNNELAGEAAVMHAFQCLGMMPYEARVAVVGRGNTARGAMRALSMLGADVRCYDRRTEGLLRDELGEYDAVVNCVLWDLSRGDHIISRADLAKMRPGSMIVDVSCDRGGGVETSVPTTIEEPTYVVDGVLHYAVDHTPALYYKTFTRDNSRIMRRYLGEFLSGEYSEALLGSLIIDEGRIVDEEISSYQKR